MKKIFVSLLLVSMVFTSFSQKIIQKSGSLNPIRGQTIVEIQFTYNDMTVGKMSEADYVQKKMEEADKRDGDGGEKWFDSWNSDRSERFQPKFILLFNKYSKLLHAVENNEAANYIMIVNTFFTEPGFDVGVAGKPAFISTTITFVAKDNPENEIALFEVLNAKGLATFDTGFRIQEAYAKTGKGFGAYLSKNLK